MAEPPDLAPGPEDYDGHRQAIRWFLERQVALLEIVLHAIHEGDPQWSPDQVEVAETIGLMVQAVGVSGRSILRLTEDLGMGTRDCLGIARSIVEASLNVSFICAKGPSAARRAKRHALQKGFRDLDRDVSIAGYRVKVARSGPSPSPSDYPELDEALREFTSRKGREITDWTEEGLYERIGWVRATFGDVGIPFAVALVAIYRHSSEILHGTYFGAIYFWSAGDDRPPVSRRHMEFKIVGHLVTVYTAAFFAMHAMAAVVSEVLLMERVGQGNAHLLKKSEHYVQGSLQHLRPPPETVALG